MISYPARVKFILSLFFSEPSHACLFYAGELIGGYIFEQTMVARLCDTYHSIVLARLQFAHLDVLSLKHSHFGQLRLTAFQ